MARRGAELREHILWTAKSVFLEQGFERTSMDLVAARAATSKRSLYAHFANKDALFAAVLELVRELFLGRLGIPGERGEAPADALVAFCARYLDAMTYQANVRMSRVCMAEAERFPQGAAGFFDVVFTQVQARLAAYLATLGLPETAAEQLLARVLHPHYQRALFGIDALRDRFAPDEVDLAPIRRAVEELLRAAG